MGAPISTPIQTGPETAERDASESSASSPVTGRPSHGWRCHLHGWWLPLYYFVASSSLIASSITFVHLPFLSSLSW